MTTRALTDDDLDVVRDIYAEGIATRNATFETEVPSADVLVAQWLPGHRWVAELDGAGGRLDRHQPGVATATATPASGRPAST